MMMSPGARVARTILVLGSLWLLVGLDAGSAADSKESIVPDADYSKLLDQQLKVLDATFKTFQESKDLSEKKKLPEKARCTAVMIAAIAQDNLSGKAADARATLRDSALELAALIKKGKMDDAAKKAAALKDLKPDPKAKKEKVKLFETHIDLQEVMSQYKLPKAGGQGMESQLLKMSADKKKTVPPAAMDSLLLTAYQTALAAELTREYMPPKANDVKPWQGFSDDMRKGSLDVAAMIQAKDGKGAYTALNKLNTSCSQCHEKFRK